MKHTLLTLFLIGCGYPGAIKSPDEEGVYYMPYCSNESDCIEAAEDVCPQGYDVLVWRNHPEKIACKR